MGVSPLEGSDLAPLPLGFTEYKESGEEDFNWKEGKADLIRIFDGRWEHRHPFIFQHILPNIAAANGETVFSSPSVYPEYHNARAYRASIKGFGTTRIGDTGLIKHAMARITVHYSTPDFTDDSQDSGRPPGSEDRLYVIETVDTETEILPIPARKSTVCYHSGMDDIPCVPYQVGDGGYETEAEYLAVVGEKVVKKLTELGKIPYRINRFNYKLKLPYVLYPRWAEIDFCLGKLNYIPFITPSGLFAAPGQLRYDGLSSVTKRELSVGHLLWEMEHKFCYYKPGWNTVPDADETTGLIRNVVINPPLYEDAVHQLIFGPMSRSLIASMREWWRRQNVEIRRRIYNAKRDRKLTQGDIVRLITAQRDWHGWSPFEVTGYDNSLWSGEEETFVVEGSGGTVNVGF